MKATISINSPGSDPVHYTAEGTLAEIKRRAKSIAANHIEPAIAIRFGDALQESVDLRATSISDHFYWCVWGSRLTAEDSRKIEAQLLPMKEE